MAVEDWSDDAVARRRMVGVGLWEPPPRGSPEDAVRHLTAVQAQEHPYARWSIAQRSGATAAEVDAAFDAGRFLRTHVLRPTWHYVAADDLRWLVSLSGPIVDARNGRRYEELDLDGPTRRRAVDVIAGAVAGGPLSRSELAAELERDGISTAGQRIAHLLLHAELRGVICSGPMHGKAHTYAAFDQRVPPGGDRTRDDAVAELARRYFTTRGPATLKDFCWWSGLPAADARSGIAGAGPDLESSRVDGRDYWFGEGALPPPPTSGEPRVDLVQCYDEIIISYSESRDVLASPAVGFPVPRHLDGFTHVVLLDGRLLGHWRARRARGATTVETRIHGRLPAAARAALQDATSRYERFVA